MQLSVVPHQNEAVLLDPSMRLESTALPGERDSDLHLYTFPRTGEQPLERQSLSEAGRLGNSSRRNSYGPHKAIRAGSRRFKTGSSDRWVPIPNPLKRQKPKRSPDSGHQYAGADQEKLVARG
jgi:hypothetical protein